LRKVFLDCGGHKASSVKMFYRYYPEATQYEVHSFEANPHLHHFFKEKKTKLHPKAVWIKDGEIEFWIGRNPVNMSATLIEGKTTGNFREKPIVVPCLDFSRWLKKNFTIEDHIVLKLDIEGAEYAVLNKMFEDGTIDYISDLYVDWHYSKIPMNKDDHFAMLARLQQRGLVAKDWAAESQHIEGITDA